MSAVPRIEVQQTFNVAYAGKERLIAEQRRLERLHLARLRRAQAAQARTAEQAPWRQAAKEIEDRLDFHRAAAVVGQRAVDAECYLDTIDDWRRAAHRVETSLKARQESKEALAQCVREEGKMKRLNEKYARHDAERQRLREEYDREQSSLREKAQEVTRVAAAKHEASFGATRGVIHDLALCIKRDRGEDALARQRQLELAAARLATVAAAASRRAVVRVTLRRWRAAAAHTAGALKVAAAATRILCRAGLRLGLRQWATAVAQLRAVEFARVQRREEAEGGSRAGYMRLFSSENCDLQDLLRYPWESAVPLSPDRCLASALLRRRSSAQGPRPATARPPARRPVTATRRIRSAHWSLAVPSSPAAAAPSLAAHSSVPEFLSSAPTGPRPSTASASRSLRSIRPRSVGRRPQSVGRRPQSVGRRPQSVGRRPQSVGRRPRSPVGPESTTIELPPTPVFFRESKKEKLAFSKRRARSARGVRRVVPT